jgi:hypothetical protein
MGIAPDLMTCSRMAVRAMIDWLVGEQGLEPDDAYILCSIIGDLKIIEVVDSGVWTVSMSLPLEVFEAAEGGGPVEDTQPGSQQVEEAARAGLRRNSLNLPRLVQPPPAVVYLAGDRGLGRGLGICTKPGGRARRSVRSR